MSDERLKLELIHQIRWQCLWGYHAAIPEFPKDDKEFRAVTHGSKHDTAVHMARYHLKLAQAIKDAGLLE